MRKMFVALTAVVALAVGCHAQMPPTLHSATLTWQATTSGGTAPYKYVMSSIAIPNGSIACPLPNVLLPNYAPLNSASPVAALTFTDTSATGKTVCYTVQAVDSLAAVSLPSTAAGPFAVPTAPAAPQQLGGNVTAKLDQVQPPLAKPSEGPDAPRVVAKLEGRIR